MSQDQTGLFILYDKVVRNGFEGDHFIGGVSEHFRNLMVAKDPKTINLLEAGIELKQRYRTQAELIPNSLLLNALNIANQCEVQYKTSKNHRLHVELALMKMCYLTTVMKPAEVATAEVKKNSDNGVSAPVAAAAPTAQPTPPVAKEVPKAAEPIVLEEPKTPYKAPVPEEKKPVAKPAGNGLGMPSLTGVRISDIHKEEVKKEEVVATASGEIVNIDPEALKNSMA